MPYATKKVGKKWQVVNAETGSVKAGGTSKKNAKGQINLLRGIEHGWTPKKK